MVAAIRQWRETPVGRARDRQLHVRLNRPLYIFYLIGFLFVGGGFVVQTGGGDLRTAQDAGAGSLLSQAILGTFYLTATLLLVSGKGTAGTLTRTWYLLLVPILALLSTAWSPDPALTFRRALAFSGTILFGLSLASAYGPRDAAILVCRGLTVAVLMSLCFVLLLPRYGVHQAFDAVQAVHAGSWRGIFAHRNTLGLWTAAALVFQLAIGRESLGGTIPWVAAVTMTLACVLGTGSSAGLAISALASLFYFSLVSTAWQTLRMRVIVAAAALVIALVVATFFDEIAAFSLALLGRDNNLTGRTILWYYVLQLIGEYNWFFGLGYYAGMLDLGERLANATGVLFVNIHNGYLECLVYLGVIGLSFCFFTLVWIGALSLRLALAYRPREVNFAAVPALIIFLISVHNFVESTLVLPNNLNSMLLAVAAGMTARKAGSRSVGREPS